MSRPSLITHSRPVLTVVAGAESRRFALASLSDEGGVKAQMERILRSRIFRGARRSQLFLRYMLHHAMAHPGEPLKEYSIAVDVFDRDASYDPAVNNTVRVEAGRLRSRLLEYYAGEGREDPVLFEVPKGSYRVLIHTRAAVASVAMPPAAPVTGTLQSSTPARLSPLWAVPLAFVVGALIGYRTSH